MHGQRGLSLAAFSVKDGRGEHVSLEMFQHVPAVLIVNVASYCGYTDRNYRELQALREDYGEDKLAIVAFPCDQFGAKEPGTWGEIVSLAQGLYGVTFPIMGKVHVNGHQSDPLFAWLKAASGNPVDIPWNFSRFLVAHGDIVKRYSHEASWKQTENDIAKAAEGCADLRDEM